MPILLLLFGLIVPRIVLVVLYFFTRLLDAAYSGRLLLLILGFLLLPTTTLAYAWAVHSAGGVNGTFWVVVMVLAVLLDVSGWRLGRRSPAYR